VNEGRGEQGVWELAKGRNGARKGYHCLPYLVIMGTGLMVDSGSQGLPYLMRIVWSLSQANVLRMQNFFAVQFVAQ